MKLAAIAAFSGLALGVSQETCTNICRKTKYDTLTADMSRYPGYLGPHEVSGSVTVRTSGSGSLQVKLDVSGVPVDCVGCGVHIHEGTTCATSGPHYWTPLSEPDPWTAARFSATSDATSSSVIYVNSGYVHADNENHAVVIHDAEGTRIACGVLQNVPKEPTLGARRATLENYPGYAPPPGADSVSGRVKVTFFQDGSLRLYMKGSVPTGACHNCGIHIHEGETCETAGPHYWNPAILEADPWTTDNYSFYSSDSYGAATANFFLFDGFAFEDHKPRTVVLHAEDGTRIACGVLQ